MAHNNGNNEFGNIPHDVTRDVTHSPKRIEARRKKSSRISLGLAIAATVLAVVSLPGFANQFYRQGTGHEFGEITDSLDLQLERMSESEFAPYLARCKSAGARCAALMTAGLHIPLYFFVLISIGLLTRSVSRRLRVFLRFAFFGVWIFGMLLLAFGVGFWGQAPSFFDAIGPAFVIYLLIAGFFGLIIGIGKMIQRAMGCERR